jgi:hypothetical protein
LARVNAAGMALPLGESLVVEFASVVAGFGASAGVLAEPVFPTGIVGRTSASTWSVGENCRKSAAIARTMERDSFVRTDGRNARY